jgi:uncharacterized membrane protein
MVNTPAPPAWHAPADALLRWALRHWLLVANAAVLLYGGLPWLAPLARSAGLHQLGALIFVVYRSFCHQRPDRSFFLNGYQVAFCQREAAMYTALLAGGLLFGLLRGHIRPAPLWAGGLLLLPMALDGGTHLIDDLLHLGWRGSDAVGSPNFWLRMLTGLLFALAVVLVLYPRLERDLGRET